MLEYFLFFINFISENLEKNYLFFFIIYFISLIIFFSFSLPGGPIFLLGSGFFFGFYLGFFINIISILIGSFLFVFFVKNFLKKFSNKIYLKISNKFSALVEQSSYEYLIIFRLIQGTPLLIQNLCISFLNISNFKFFLSSFIGFTPTIFVFTYFGSKLFEIYELKTISYSDIISKDFIIIIVIFILILIIRIVYKYKKINR